MSSSGSSFGSGVATAGKVIADVRAIIVSIIALAGLVLGIYLIRAAAKNNWLNATLNIQSVSCSGDTCSVGGTYNVGGQNVLVQNFSIPSALNPTVGSTLAIQFNPIAPTEIRLSGLTAASQRKLGWIIIGVSLGLAAVFWVWAWAANSSRIVAQGTAGLEAASLVGRII